MFLRANKNVRDFIRLLFGIAAIWFIYWVSLHLIQYLRFFDIIK